MNEQALFKLGYGLYVLGANDAKKPTGCIVNTVMQLCADPVVIGVAVNKANYTHDVIMESRELTVSVLDETVPFETFKRFGFVSGRDTDKFNLNDHKLAKNNTPYLKEHVAAYVSGHVTNTVDLPTHTLFVVAVDEAEIIGDEAPVTYAYYFAHIKPKPAKPKKKSWVCKICGYVYEGDELPEGYTCPLCKHPASDFELVEASEDDEPEVVANIRQINDDYWYVGGSDYRLALFESVYPLDDGVSYNSYLLMDDKTVLFDTCDSSVAGTFFDNVKAALKGRNLDYVVVNHMEPDHAATLGDLVLRYPKVKIITNKKVVQFIKQFFTFDIDRRVVLVKEGDTFDTGHHTLTFVMAPMVHWPEVMMTYDTTDGILFSADAFGSFGAIQGNLFASERDLNDRYYDDARRYYTNIVGKYGPQVMSVLKKAGNLDIKMICSLHGLILDTPEAIQSMIDYYVKWATYEPEINGVMIAYSSIYNGTKAAVEILANELAQMGVRNIKIYDASNTHPSFILADAFRYSHLVFASSSYNAGLFTSMQDLLLELQEHNLQNRTIALIQNGSWAPSALKKMKEILKSCKNLRYIDQEILIKSRVKSTKEFKELAEKIYKDLNKSDESQESSDIISKTWRCTVCGFEYQGDEPPETCPLCGMPADAFEEVK